nr:FAD-dependent oxidoreductase [Pseudomonadota bacterium]
MKQMKYSHGWLLAVGLIKDRFLLTLLTVLLLLSIFPSDGLARDHLPDYDVVVIGGTPAGVASAIAAARADKTVIIIAQAPIPGGVLSLGLLRLDDKYLASDSGGMGEVRHRVNTDHRTEG